MAKKKYVIGIDLGGTKVLLALLDKKCRVLSRIKIKTKIDASKKSFLRELQNQIGILLRGAKVRLGEVAAIGIGCPGIVASDSGEIISAPNVPFLNHFSLAPALHDILHVPIVIENDVNAGLYAEYQFGSARGAHHIVGVFIGTGIGGAIILDDKIYRGASGAAGEIGHMVVQPNGPLCGCGEQGCFETVSGRLGIVREAAALAMRGEAPKLFKMAGTDLSQMKSGILAKAIQAGDEKLRELMVQKAEVIGLTLVSLANVLNPDLFVLGGGVVEAMGDLILPMAKKVLKNHGMSAIVKSLKVVQASLGDDAVVMGAGRIAWDLVKK